MMKSFLPEGAPSSVIASTPCERSGQLGLQETEKSDATHLESEDLLHVSLGLGDCCTTGDEADTAIYRHLSKSYGA